MSTTASTLIDFNNLKYTNTKQPLLASMSYPITNNNSSSLSSSKSSSSSSSSSSSAAVESSSIGGSSSSNFMNRPSSSSNKYYAASSSATSSTGGATSLLSSKSTSLDYAASNTASSAGIDLTLGVDERLRFQTPDMNNESKLDQLEFLTTVGTGTFGRVIVVKHKRLRDYYALKVMSIAEVLRLKQTDHVKNEKDILLQVKHPFIINLYWTSHNDKFLYMLLEYVCGGELFSYLRNAVKFSNDTAIFYTAEIVSALDYLHSLSIIYRDLKPENLLLDQHGHIRMCDFGFAKKVYDRTWTLCGTPEYLAPEIIVGKGHHKAVDWWALGILIYEMLAGYPPFYDENPFQIYQKILAGKIEWPRHIDPVAKDLIKKLLVNDRTKRLGAMKNGTEDIKSHKWFKSIDWSVVAERKLVPPIVPKVNHSGDTKNFDKYDEEGWYDVPVVSAKNLEPFESF